MPWGTNEPALLRWQRGANKSIFACEKHAVYSNTTSEDLKGLDIMKIDHDLSCPIGGQWNTRLNTWIFMKLWRQVWLDGQFQFAAWTVKVDPDAVFLPQRLRDVVGDAAHAQAQQGNGIFSSNCESHGSLHGAIEVLSRRAFEVYATRNWPSCPRPMQEDEYMRQCLQHLGVREMKDFVFLGEQYCTPDWTDCKSSRVTFHPYKTLSLYQGCMARAEGWGSWGR
jgi:hypothetical protein